VTASTFLRAGIQSEARMAERRMGWMPLPVICPRCRKRIRETAIITHGGAVRCDRGCGILLYVLPSHQLGITFVAEVNATEALDIRARGLSLVESLDYLGAIFPGAA
jgi:hypothetical protein